jgi:hypothetical protein
MKVQRRRNHYQVTSRGGNENGHALAHNGVLTIATGPACEPMYYEHSGEALEGVWLYGRALGDERATVLERSGSALAGLYSVSGSPAEEGGRYSGQLRIKGSGPAYRLRWDAGAVFQGVAYLSGDLVSVSQGSDDAKCGVTHLKRDANGFDGVRVYPSGRTAPVTATSLR